MIFEDPRYSKQVSEGVVSSVSVLQSTYSACAEWTFERVFIEIFLGVIFLANVFSTFILFTTSLPRKSNIFMLNCTKLISISNTFTVLHLLLYPFLFTWDHLMVLDNAEGTETEVDVMMRNFSSDEIHQMTQTMDDIYSNFKFHPCQQAGKLPCRISGILFGLFLFVPLASLAVMTIDTALFAFRWKMHRFRPHTVSTLRLTLLIGSYFAIATSFALPSFGIGTHYHYHEFLKICWLSVDMEDFFVQGFAYFICGFGCFLLLLTILFAYLVLQAYRAQQKSVNQVIGHQCTLLIGQYKVVTSRTWVSYARLVLWMDAIALVAYLPLTAGYVVRYALLLDDIYWFNLVNEIALFIMPTISPFLTIGLCKPHLRRLAEIFRLCTRNSGYNQRVSPLTRPASTWSYQSSPFSDAGERTLDRYTNNYGGNDYLSAAQKRGNFGLQKRGVHLGVDRLRDAYPTNQYTFSQIPTASFSTMYSDVTADDYLEDNTQRNPQTNFSPQRFARGDKRYAERQRRFYAMQPLPQRESIFSKLARPVDSIRANRRTPNNYQRPLYHNPQYGIPPRRNVVKRSQALLPGSDRGKWKISDSFYADSFEDNYQYGNTPKDGRQSGRENIMYSTDTFGNTIENRTPTVRTVDKQNNPVSGQTINSSIYTFDDSQQNETLDRVFQPNFSYHFQRQPRR